MFPYFPQQSSSVVTANLQTLVNVTKRYASGLQQLAELNVQKVKTVFEESTSVLKAGSSAKPGEFLSWQSTLFAEIPEKAAAYTRYFLTIVRATEADILNEARSQYEQYGFGMKGVLDSAVRQDQSAAQGPIALLSDITTASTDAANVTGGIVLDASEETAQKTLDRSAGAADGAQEASEAALRPAKANSKR